MISRYEIRFLLWRIYQRLKGFKVGTIVKIYSQEKGKYIKGCISSIYGGNPANTEHSFYFGVNLFEPLKGNNSEFHSWESYQPKDFKFNPVDRTFYTKMN